MNREHRTLHSGRTQKYQDGQSHGLPTSLGHVIADLCLIYPFPSRSPVLPLQPNAISTDVLMEPAGSQNFRLQTNLVLVEMF